MQNHAQLPSDPGKGRAGHQVSCGRNHPTKANRTKEKQDVKGGIRSTPHSLSPCLLRRVSSGAYRLYGQAPRGHLASRRNGVARGVPYPPSPTHSGLRFSCWLPPNHTKGRRGDTSMSSLLRAPPNRNRCADGPPARPPWAPPRAPRAARSPPLGSPPRARSRSTAPGERGAEVCGGEALARRKKQQMSWV